MNIKRLFSAVLVAGMLAAPAFAKPEVSGVVQGNWGDNVYIGSQGRAYEIPVDRDARFLVDGVETSVRDLAPGMHVQAFGDCHEISEPQYGGYHSDEFWEHMNGH